MLQRNSQPCRGLLPLAPLLLAACVLACLPPLHAQAQNEASPTASVAFHFERAGLRTPSYTLLLHEDGSGAYTTPSPDANAQQQSTPLTFTPATTARIFTAAHALDDFHTDCGSHRKNIASSGAKTLTYTRPTGQPTACTFDYTEDKRVAALTSLFESIQLTLEEGQRLASEHRYDRLALDTEMDTLTKAVQDGTASELTLVRPTLESLAADPDLLLRVRTRAAALLRLATPASSPP